MMRKNMILAFLTSCFLMGSLPAMAQGEDEQVADHLGQALITNASQLSSNASDEIEGLHIEWLIDQNTETFWHADWHGKVAAPYYLEIAFPEPLDGYYAFQIGRRMGKDNCHPTKMRVEESADGNTWTTVKNLELPYTQPGEIICSDIFRVKNSRHLRFICTATNTNTTTWHASEFQVYSMDDSPFAVNKAFLDFFQAYEEYYWETKPLNMGTGFGQYSDSESYDTFRNLMEQAYQIIDKTVERPTDAELLSLMDQIEAAYKRILASEVLYSFPNGYYRIMTGLKYYTEEETGEVDLDGNPIKKKTFHDNALYSTLDGWAWWGRKDNQDCRQVWRLDMQDGNVKMVNVATDMQLAGLKDGAMSMSAQVDTLMGFDYVGTENEHDIFYIRFASTPRDLTSQGSPYLHQWYHGRGAGTGHTLCMWQPTWNKGEEYVSDKGTSEYYLEAVSEEEVQQLIEAFAVYKDHDKMVVNYKDYIAKAKPLLETAYDIHHAYEADTLKPQITSTTQFSSLWTEPNEGSFDYILDGNATTFWHSRWSANKATGPHQASFEITVEEPLIGQFHTYVLRRSGPTMNHITKMSLYGSNDPDALAETQDTKWELICDNVSTPWSSGQKDVYSQMFYINKPYKYLRFYEENTAGTDQTAYTGCSHYATFQIYATHKKHTTQFEAMGEKGAALAAIVDAYPTQDMATLTAEQYNALVKAYQDFAEILVDPAPLRNAINAQQKTTKGLLVGQNPGCWTGDAEATALDALLAQAKQYDATGAFTQEQTDAFISGLTRAGKDFYAAAIPVDSRKWYYLHFDSEANFEANGWSKVSATQQESNLFDNYVAAGERTETEAHTLGNADIKEGASMYYFKKEMIENDEAAQFRFIQLTDTTYAIQNRASGLFIHRNLINGSGGITLQMTPSAFTITPIGYGQHILSMTGLDGTKPSNPNLNAWAHSVASLLATWSDINPGCNSHFLIEPVEDVTTDYSPGIERERLVGEITPMCFPSPMRVDGADLYKPLGCFRKDDTEYIALSLMDNDVPAGQPFFCVAEGTYDGVTTEKITFYPGSQLISRPDSINGLIGTFEITWLGTGYIYFTENHSATIEGTDTGRNYGVPANSAYFKYGYAFLPEGEAYDMAIQIGGKYTDFEDHIDMHQAMDDLSRPGTVYDLSGRIVRRNATFSDLRALGTGLYILNGRKVIVK